MKTKSGLHPQKTSRVAENHISRKFIPLADDNYVWLSGIRNIAERHGIRLRPSDIKNGEILVLKNGGNAMHLSGLAAEFVSLLFKLGDGELGRDEFLHRFPFADKGIQTEAANANRGGSSRNLPEHSRSKPRGQAQSAPKLALSDLPDRLRPPESDEEGLRRILGVVGGPGSEVTRSNGRIYVRGPVMSGEPT